MVQLELISGFYVCQDCGRVDAPYLVRVKRFRICQVCFDALPPCVLRDDGAGTWEQVENFWAWYAEMERRYPLQRVFRPARRTVAEKVRQFNIVPVCPTCGGCIVRQLRRRPDIPATLWGGPFQWLCERCDLRRNIEYLATSPLSAKLRPDWDDEDWLDYLFQDMPRAFEIGLLPDLWFELRRT